MVNRRKILVRIRAPFCRPIVRVLIALQAVNAIPVSAQAPMPRSPEPIVATSTTAELPAVTPKKIVPNRKLPSVLPPQLVPKFGDSPTAMDLTRARVFVEPLRPVGGMPTMAENRDLADALEATAAEGIERGMERLQRFAVLHHDSPWRASVLANLAYMQDRSGYFSRAAENWREAWEISKHYTDVDAQTVAGFTMSEWMNQAAKFGQVDVLERYLPQTINYPFSGAAASGLTAARQKHWFLVNKHEQALFSGPEALKTLAMAGGSLTERVSRTIAAYVAPHEGTSLVALKALAESAGVSLQMRYYERPEEIPPMSIVHLRTQHYSTLVSRQGGQFVLRDLAFGGEMYLTEAAFRDEASGYVLTNQSETGSRVVGDNEAAKVFGHCLPGAGYFDEGCPCGGGGGGAGMPAYYLHPLAAAVMIYDRPLEYQPPRGPGVSFKLTFNHRSGRQGTSQAYGSIGSQWSHAWLSYVQDNNSTVLPPYAWTSVLLRGESVESFNSFSGFTHWKSRATLVKVANDPPRYERRLPDGGMEVFAFPDRAASLPNRKVFLTEVIDPQGQSLTFTYDSSVRLVAVTDAIGQVTTLDYLDSGNPLKLTKVTDPFGRTALMTYDASGRLASITDAIGMTSSFAYETNGFLVSMTTPYGTTTFRNGDPSSLSNAILRVDATDPEGGTERIEFHQSNTAQQAASVPSGEVPTGFSVWNLQLDQRNSLYWDKRAMMEAPGDVSRAVVTHWLMREDAAYDAHPLSRAIPHSIKKPLETRVWYRYPDQGPSNYSVAGTSDQPSLVARKLNDGTTQLDQYAYNAMGNVTSHIDPVGRETTFVYSLSGIDLIETRQTTGIGYDILSAYGNYLNHRPQLLADHGVGPSTISYSSSGRPLVVTNAKNEVTSYAYEAGDLYLMSIARNGIDVATFEYDALGRISTVSDSQGYEVGFEYDGLNRVTKRTYPDGTYEENGYARLDLVRERDRQGRTTEYFYDRLGRLTATRDPLGRVTRQEWCVCGAIDRLVDPNGNTVAWDRNATGRVVKQTRATLAITAYTYDATGRLLSMTDPKGQVSSYSYFPDDSVHTMQFSNSAVATPAVTYSYDSFYRRMASMIDGGGTTSYTYRTAGQLGAGMLASVDGPLSNDVIEYTYDELGRVVGRTVNGTANQVVLEFDTRGRVSAEVNNLGEFETAYVGASNNVESVTYPNGQVSLYEYFPANNSGRLQHIRHLAPNGATLSRHDYTYDVVGNVASWTQQLVGASTVWAFGYDAANQLNDASKWSVGGTPVQLEHHIFGYDAAGNRKFEQHGNASTATAYDALNRATARGPGGTIGIAGVTNEPARIVIQGQPVPTAPDNTFRGSAPVSVGANVISITAVDPTGNSTNHQYQVTQSGPSASVVYDQNGNMTSDGIRTFEWDARNSVTAVNVGAHRTEMFYDGMMRRVRIIEKESGVAQSDTRLIWCEDVLCETRTGSDSRRIFQHGELLNSAAQFFTRDHLGSVIDVVDERDQHIAQYSYDPWGQRSLNFGTDATSIGFTGHEWHSQTFLTFTRFRQYDAASGRWTSEDPASFADGLNLSRYAQNNPVSVVDPLGLACQEVFRIYLGSSHRLISSTPLGPKEIFSIQISMTFSRFPTKYLPRTGWLVQCFYRQKVKDTYVITHRYFGIYECPDLCGNSHYESEYYEEKHLEERERYKQEQIIFTMNMWDASALAGAKCAERLR